MEEVMTPEVQNSTANQRLSLIGMSPSELKPWLAAHGQPGYRAEQILRWVLQRRAESFDAMSDLPKSLR
ncbi:MAG: 23S rRNA (adenine(2503)-C(2))-methyltransferase RlmN, partial [Pirellulaceae bacterium]